MDLSKFLSLLQTGRLYFPSLKSMTESDKFEGALPVSIFEHKRWNTMDDVPPNRRDFVKSLNGLEFYKQTRDGYAKRMDLYKRTYFINCWHMNEGESMAMWDIYASRQQGIAIVSSEECMEAAFDAGYARLGIEGRVHGSKVSYVNYNDESLARDSVVGFNPFLNKRQAFHYEQEYRLFTISAEAQIGIGNAISAGFDDDPHHVVTMVGVGVPCDLGKLIQRIYVSPFAPGYFSEAVKNLCVQYGLGAKITPSELSESPMK